MSRHLMARFRHLRTAGWADWKVVERYPSFGPEARTEQAKLENGHTLNIGSFSWGRNSNFWDYHITDHEGTPVGWGGAADDNSPADGQRGTGIMSADEAKQLAEEHYQRLFPLGTDTGRHDSGVDYSDLNKFMGEL